MVKKSEKIKKESSPKNKSNEAKNSQKTDAVNKVGKRKVSFIL
jgi:hypothetical protein